MGEYQNYNSVVINLEPTENAQTSVQTATYEQAFLGEEFSDARGKGRARRKSRKLERISNKREVRTEKRKLKSDRDTERIERRKNRKSARQDIRGDQQDARMERKNKRLEAKEKRDGDSESDNEEEETDTQQDGGQDTGSSSDSGSNQSQDTSTSGGGSNDTASDEDTDDGYSNEDEIEDDTDTSGEADESFSGDSSNFASEVTGKPSVPTAIQSICYQIEMNNEMISQLLQHKKMLEARGKNTAKLNDTLGTKYDNVQSLEAKLENFSGANGKEDRQKAKAVRIAKGKARRKRIENLPIPPVMLYKLLKKGISKDKIKEWWEKRGRKEQASKFNFDGTTDDFGNSVSNDYMDYSEFGVPAYDYEQITPQMINLDNSNFEPQMNFSGADGSSSNTFWKSLLIGGVVAFAGIYVIRKYNLFK